MFFNPYPSLSSWELLRKSVATWPPDPLGVSPPRLTLRLGLWWGLNIMLGAAAGVAVRPPKTPFLGPISRRRRRVRKLDLGRVFTVLYKYAVLVYMPSTHFRQLYGSTLGLLPCIFECMGPHQVCGGGGGDHFDWVCRCTACRCEQLPRHAHAKQGTDYTLCASTGESE